MWTQPDSPGGTSPDLSSCSLDTGDVLIRSTRVLSSDRNHEVGPGPGSRSIQITVQKVRHRPVQPPLAEQQQWSSVTEKQRPEPRQKPDKAPPPRAAGLSQPDRLKKPGPTKENKEPRRRQPPAAETSPDRKLSAGTLRDQQPGHDLLTSRFAAGSRGVVLAALKQRSHSAPNRKEVKVQLLGPELLQTRSQDAVGDMGVQTEAGLPSGCLGNDTNATAAAATLIKLTEGVEKLLQADRYKEGGDRGRDLSQQTLRHLEMLHSQQLQQQSQLLESALRLLTGRTPVTCDLTASGQPHRLQVTHLDLDLDTAADVLSNQQPSSSVTKAAAATTSMETNPVAMATPRHARYAEQTRDYRRYRRGASIVTTATQPAAGNHLRSSANYSQAAARANETLREMRRLKSEMKMLLTSEDSLKSSRSGPGHRQTQENPSHPDYLRSSRPGPDHHQTQQNPSSPDYLRSSRPGPDHHQTQQNPSHPDYLRSSRSGPDHCQTQQNPSHPGYLQSSRSGPDHHRQTQQNPSHPDHLRYSRSGPDHHQTQQNPSHPDYLQSSRSGPDHHHQTQQSPSHPDNLQSSISGPDYLQSSRSGPDHHQTHQNPSHPDYLQFSRSGPDHHQTQQNPSYPDYLQSSRSGPDHHQTQQNPSHPDYLQSSRSGPDHQQSQQNPSPPDHLQSTRSGPDHHQTQQNPSHRDHLQSHSLYQQTQSQSHESPFQQIHSQQCQTQSQRSQSVLVQRRPMIPSMLEEAGLVLRQVQRQRKILEVNLEALLRAKTGEVLHCQLESLAANRDWTEEVRIKKTVDAWINTLTRDIQAKMSSEDAAMTSQQKAAGSSTHTGRGRPVSALRGKGSKTAAGRGSRRPLQEAEPDRATGESYLTHLYGRAPYEGLRRSLKKSPYLRFSSPTSPLSRKPRPRLVESVTGVKMKSCKTQTCLAPPLPPLHHDIISPSHQTPSDPADLRVTPVGGVSIPIAIPLGRPRMDSSSRCLAERKQEVTSPPIAPPISSAVAVDASDLQLQKDEQLVAPPPPPPPPPPVIIIQRKREEEEEAEDDIFPGAYFLSVADVVQQEEVSVVAEEALELEGGPSPPPVQYQGPIFPPQARSALLVQDQASVLDLHLQRDTLENRLVEWVEQQLMSRMISEMYRPPPTDPTQNDSTDQSESEKQSVTSDIVEAAGDGGLQLFVDSNTSVDSALIRQLVSEVLTEHVALMLGQRDSRETEPEPGLEPPESSPGAPQEDKLVPLVATPVPTPPPSPAQPSRETPPLMTPPLSEPTSLLNDESPQSITAPEPVATPTSSPEPAHSAGSPPADHQAPPPLACGDAELPLDEERPEEHLDTRPQPLEMPVAEEEPLLSSPLPAPSPPPPSGPDSRPASPSIPDPRTVSPSVPDPRPASPSSPHPRPVSLSVPDPRPASPSSPDPRPASSSSSSEDSSSSAVTAARFVSDGELLTVNQSAAMTGKDTVDSFSCSLQDLQEMDFDHSSEGQVSAHDLLMTETEQHTHRGERPQPEGSWGRDQEEDVSTEEMRDNQTTKPHRTTNAKSTAAHRGQTLSPGLICQAAEGHFEVTNESSFAVGDLMAEPMGTLTSDLQSDLSLTPPPPPLHTDRQVLPVRASDFSHLIHQTRVNSKEKLFGIGREDLAHFMAEQQQGGASRMEVHLPSITPQEDEEVMEEGEEEVSAADPDSSSDDVF